MVLLETKKSSYHYNWVLITDERRYLVAEVESVAVDMKERKLTVIGEAEEATVLLYKNHYSLQQARKKTSIWCFDY